jgi:hypothetical protein
MKTTEDQFAPSVYMGRGRWHIRAICFGGCLIKHITLWMTRLYFGAIKLNPFFLSERAMLFRQWFAEI